MQLLKKCGNIFNRRENNEKNVAAAFILDYYFGLLRL